MSEPDPERGSQVDDPRQLIKDYQADYLRLRQVMRDLLHELKLPVRQLHERAALLASARGQSLPERQFRQQLFAIRGLSAKIWQVTSSFDLFEDLMRGEPIRLRLEQFEGERLCKLLVEAARDHEALVSPSEHLEFQVECRALDRLDRLEVYLDYTLLQQAMYNLLDNATKYSYPHTRVRIGAHVTDKKWFCVTVANIGLPISEHELPQCTQRGWRGESAHAVTDAGSGLGLWIVDHIMKAHGGQFIIRPTTPESVTEVSLIFRGRSGR